MRTRMQILGEYLDYKFHTKELWNNEIWKTGFAFI